MTFSKRTEPSGASERSERPSAGWAERQLPLDHQALDDIDRRAHAFVALAMRFQWNVAAGGIELTRSLMRHRSKASALILFGTVDLGDLVSNGARIGRRSDRRNKP